MLVQYGVLLETADITYGRTAAHWAVYYLSEDILVELIILGESLQITVISCMSQTIVTNCDEHNTKHKWLAVA